MSEREQGAIPVKPIFQKELQTVLLGKGKERIAFTSLFWYEKEGRIEIRSLEMDNSPKLEIEKDWRAFRAATNESGRWSSLSLVRKDDWHVELDRFSITEDRRENAITGEIIRSKECGVMDVCLEARRKDGASVTVWYDKENSDGYLFWGVHAATPRPYESVGIPPTISFRPYLVPGKIYYWAPTYSSTGQPPELSLWHDAWDLRSRLSNRETLGVIKENHLVRHKNGIKENLRLEQQNKNNVLTLEIAREAEIPESVTDDFVKRMFVPVGLKLSLPLTFPRYYTEFEMDWRERPIKDLFEILTSFNDLLGNTLLLS